MRILHTSDWHLGLSQGPCSMGPDHDLFFDWLQRTLAEREIDALVVAGDVFDTMQPTVDALSRYFKLLAKIGESGVKQVIIIGGNHDSASRLDAPAEVLSALQVHVVGGIDGSPESQARCLVPLYDRAGEPRAVCLAVPYVHEFRLGVRTTDLDQAAVRAQFAERFGAIYSALCDAAEARFPGLPIVATGHLTMGPATKDDYPQVIHHVGAVEGLPESVVDPRIQYLALGHIHRSYPVANRRGWYSGSPIAFNVAEGRTPRRVLEVELSAEPGGSAKVSPLMVPKGRSLLEKTGSLVELEAWISGLQWDDPLPPLLFVQARLAAPEPELMNRLNGALAKHPEGRRPAIANTTVVGAHGADDRETGPPPSLAELKPADVLRQLCQHRGFNDDDGPLNAAFATIVTVSKDEWDAQLRRVEQESL
jgi:exonuclease SbcD